MAKVTIPPSLTRFSDGLAQLTAPAENYRALLRDLEQQFPGIGEELGKLAVAIDGTIYQTPLLEPLGPHSEVFFLPRIEGG